MYACPIDILIPLSLFCRCLQGEGGMSSAWWCVYVCVEIFNIDVHGKKNLDAANG